MKALFESQRTLDIERKLFANERHLQLSESENLKLRAKLDELKLKYEPEGVFCRLSLFKSFVAFYPGHCKLTRYCVSVVQCSPQMCREIKRIGYYINMNVVMFSLRMSEFNILYSKDLSFSPLSISGCPKEF